MVVIRKKHQENAAEKEARLKNEQISAMGVQDQYQARGFELVSWVQDNRILVSAFIALVLIVGALFSGYLYYQKRVQEEASALFLQAMTSLENVKDEKEKAAAEEKAQSSLIALAESHPRAKIAVLAKFYAAYLAMDADNVKKASELYQSAIDQVDRSDDLYTLALIGLGHAQEKGGETEAALKTFETLVELKINPSKDLALYKAAELANELKEHEKAKKNLARLLEEYPASAYEKDAQRLKETLQ